MAHVQDISPDELFALCRDNDALPSMVYLHEVDFPLSLYTLLVACLAVLTWNVGHIVWRCVYYQQQLGHARHHLAQLPPARRVPPPV